MSKPNPFFTIVLNDDRYEITEHVGYVYVQSWGPFDTVEEARVARHTLETQAAFVRKAAGIVPIK